MLELIIVIALILLIRLWVNPRKKRKSSAVEKENNSGKKNPESIVGKSTFVLGAQRQNQAQIKKQKEPVPGSSGKIDIEVPLDYEPDNDLLQELEELKRLGMQTGFSSDITFDEMISVVNEVGKDKTKAAPKTGKLLYENENTDWVEQLASSSEKNANRITSLIDLHLGRLAKIEAEPKLEDDGFRRFDIGDYI